MEIYKFTARDAFDFAGSQGIRTRTSGDELQFMRCPYCHGGGGSDKWTFAINLTTGQFNCKRASCNAHGNMITLSRDFNFSLGTEVDEYYNSRKQFAIIPEMPKPKPKPAALAFLESRGISAKVAEEYNITVQTENENILVFPFYDESGILQFIKYRKTDFDKEKDKSKEWCEANCKPILFGMNHCDTENKTLVMTEGQMDSLALAEAGVRNAVSVPTGAKGFTWVPYCWDFLNQFDTLIVFGDYENDQISLLTEMGKRFGGMVKHIREEDYQGCKDANEILMKCGKDALVQAVSHAVPVSNPRIIPMEDIERVNLSQLEKISTGFVGLDRILGGLYFGQVVLLTGERGEGKSTLASQIATFAVKEGHPVFMYSGELMDWHVKAWFEQQAAGPDYVNTFSSNLGYKSYSVQGEILPAIEMWYSGKAFVYDNGIIGAEGEQETLLQTAEISIRQYGCRMLIFDNLMTAIMDDEHSDLNRVQTNFVKDLTRLAKRYDVLILLVAHPKKGGYSKDFDNDDISGSANITNLVDVVIRYGKPKKKDGETVSENERLLSVHKNRLSGKLNTDGIKVWYDEKSKRISENADNFGWRLGWEPDGKAPDDGFRPILEEIDLPF